MNTPDPNTPEAMRTLVLQCEGGRVIYRNKRGAAWLCSVDRLKVNDDSFYVDLTPIRRVDTAWWRHEAAPPPFQAGGPWKEDWGGIKGRKHAIVCTGYVDWCITFDPEKVQEIVAMAEAPKMPVGDLLSVLRCLEIE